MKLLFGVFLWCLLLLLCWPLAVLVLISFPLIWLLSIPFRLLAMVIGAVLRLVKAILYLPARLLEPRRPMEARAG